MATINQVTTRIGDGAYQTVWPASGTGFAADTDVGTDLRAATYPYKSIHVDGTFGGNTITIQVSQDGTNYTAAEDSTTGAPLTFALAGFAVAFLPDQYVRPIASAGAAGNIKVTINSYTHGVA